MQKFFKVPNFVEKDHGDEKKIMVTKSSDSTNIQNYEIYSP